MIGVDLFYIPRMQKLIDIYGYVSLKNMFHDNEIEQNDKRMACKFAIKEATAKAFKTGIGKELGFKDIMIDRCNGYIVACNNRRVEVSVSYENNYVIAVVIVV